MQIDSTNTDFSIWSNSWLSPSTIVALLAFIFVLYKYWQLKKIAKPTFTYFTHITDTNGEHFVAVIASGFSGAIPHPKFFIARLFLGFIPTRRYFLNSILKDDSAEIARIDSEIPRTTFKEEQLFWLVTKDSFKFSKGKYKIYVKTKVGNSSIVYNREYSNLTSYVGL
jgi:hypothetical protein